MKKRKLETNKIKLRNVNDVLINQVLQFACNLFTYVKVHDVDCFDLMGKIG